MLLIIPEREKIMRGGGDTFEMGWKWGMKNRSSLVFCEWGICYLYYIYNQYHSAYSKKKKKENKQQKKQAKIKQKTMRIIVERAKIRTLGNIRT